MLVLVGIVVINVCVLMDVYSPSLRQISLDELREDVRGKDAALEAATHRINQLEAESEKGVERAIRLAEALGRSSHEPD